MNENTKSNLPLYQSCDRRFVLKCIAKEDVEQIHNILPEYHRVNFIDSPQSPNMMFRLFSISLKLKVIHYFHIIMRYID